VSKSRVQTVIRALPAAAARRVLCRPRHGDPFRRQGILEEE